MLFRVFSAAFLALSIGALSAANAFETKAREAIIVDDATQTVLYAKEANKPMPPSSMSKLMTLYLLFDSLKSGALTLDSTLRVSENAWRMGGSKMFVPLDSQVRVEDLIRGIIVQSGNDACVVVAEALGGSEQGFAVMMNRKAAEIGLKASHFANSTGWPDEKHVMTPADLAQLSYKLVHDFPEYYPYFSEKEFTYNGITQSNRNRLLWRNTGVDGLKTGHTEIAGYGITISAKDEATGRRVHVVVNGLENDVDRIDEAGRLAEHGLRDFALRPIGTANVPLESLPVYMGAADAVAIGFIEPQSLMLARDATMLRFVLSANAPVMAPISKGQELGKVIVKHEDQILAWLPVVALHDVPEAGLWRRFTLNLRQLLQ